MIHGRKPCSFESIIRALGWKTSSPKNQRSSHAYTQRGIYIFPAELVGETINEFLYIGGNQKAARLQATRRVTRRIVGIVMQGLITWVYGYGPALKKFLFHFYDNKLVIYGTLFYISYAFQKKIVNISKSLKFFTVASFYSFNRHVFCDRQYCFSTTKSDSNYVSMQVSCGSTRTSLNTSRATRAQKYLISSDLIESPLLLNMRQLY